MKVKWKLLLDGCIQPQMYSTDVDDGDLEACPTTKDQTDLIGDCITEELREMVDFVVVHVESKK